MTGDHAHEEARIYWLCNPVDIKAGERAIIQILYETLQITRPAGQRVRVSESMGSIEYVNTEQLWRKGSPPQLPDRENAKKKAEDFLRALRAAYEGRGRTRLPERMAGLVLMPPLRPTELVLVTGPDRPAGDHWLYRAQPQLSLLRDGHQMADVFGAIVEVCIGEGGQIIAYQSRWRPLTTERTYAQLIHFPASEGHGHGSESGGSQPPAPRLVYLLDGDLHPQYYLSPYYLSVEEDHLHFSSAGAYSLTAALSVKEEEEGTSIKAVVEGGSGQYTFEWAYTSIDDPWEQALHELGPGRGGTLRTEDGRQIRTSQVILTPGAYLMLLNIKDRRTGAFKHHQQYVYSFPVLRERPPEEPRVA